jgi:hypothetical protein
MKLTKIHIFLILLLALVLCSTLGMCSNQEGYTNRNDDKRNYKSYSDYNTQKNDDNIRSVNMIDGKSSNYNNPFYNKANWNSDNNNDHDHDNDNDNDRSNTNTKKYKYSPYRDTDGNRLDTVGIFDSVSKGQMNGSTYSIKEEFFKDKSNGVPVSRIPAGQEHLYILKSEIVPPICPACPDVNCGNSASNSDAKKCQPCPPCARCPEPSFECKKVPNYNSRGLMDQLPIPWADKL